MPHPQDKPSTADLAGVGDASRTERKPADLRVALKRYRSFFDRLLSV